MTDQGSIGESNSWTSALDGSSMKEVQDGFWFLWFWVCPLIWVRMWASFNLSTPSDAITEYDQWVINK